jgi:pyruvate ferredoxin oxidoreductase gamma subunit
MGELLEIRWHGRGGQGSKTAANLLAEAASDAGMHVQAFPEYGPERMGAPVVAFNRIGDEPLTIHCHVSNPHVVIVLDATLLGKVDVAEGLRPDGAIIVNTGEPAASIRRRLNLSHGKLYTLDASKVSMETLGRDIPNTPMMGALIKVTGVLDFEKFLLVTERQLAYKFKSRPEVVEGNIKAIRRAYEEVSA